MPDKAEFGVTDIETGGLWLPQLFDTHKPVIVEAWLHFFFVCDNLQPYNAKCHLVAPVVELCPPKDTMHMSLLTPLRTHGLPSPKRPFGVLRTYICIFQCGFYPLQAITHS